MSSDAHPNVPENGRTSGDGEGTDPTTVESDTSVESTETVASTDTAASEPADTTTAEPAAPSERVTSEEAAPAAAAPAPAGDQTHVALPAQREEGFDEVDGGDPAQPTADGTATTAFVPTAEEDAALRDERARRFGRPQRAASEPSEEPSAATVVAPVAAGAAAGAATGAAAESRSAGPSTQTMPATPPTTESGDDPFAEFDEGPSSRAAAHWWSILISIVFVPVAWYLLTDGGERTAFNLTGGGPFNLAGPLELAAGALCLFFVLLAARWSSIGAILTGTISALLGIAFLAFNTEAMSLIGQYQGTLVQALNQLGQNIVDHMLADARSGRLAIYGIVLIMVGVVSHGARRQGRREEKRRAALGV